MRTLIAMLLACSPPALAQEPPEDSDPVDASEAQAEARAQVASRLTVHVFIEYLSYYSEVGWRTVLPELDQRGVRTRLHSFPLSPPCNPVLDGGLDPASLDPSCVMARAAACVQPGSDRRALTDQIFGLPRDERGQIMPATLVRLAHQAGLDAEALATCLADPQAWGELDRDIAQAMELELHGTPTWFVQGDDGPLVQLGQNGQVVGQIDAILDGGVPAGGHFEIQVAPEPESTSSSNAWPPEHQPAQAVLALTRDVPAGRRLRRKDLDWVWLPRPFVLPSHMQAPVKGMRASQPMLAGQLLRDEHVLVPTDPRPLELPKRTSPPVVQPEALPEHWMVAARPLSPGEVLTEDDVAVVSVPAGTGSEWLGCHRGGCLHSYEDLVGHRVTQRVLAHEAVRVERVE